MGAAAIFPRAYRVHANAERIDAFGADAVVFAALARVAGCLNERDSGERKP